jgi:hypothetical protein
MCGIYGGYDLSRSGRVSPRADEATGVLTYDDVIERHAGVSPANTTRSPQDVTHV